MSILVLPLQPLHARRPRLWLHANSSHLKMETAAAAWTSTAGAAALLKALLTKLKAQGHSTDKISAGIAAGDDALPQGRSRLVAQQPRRCLHHLVIDLALFWV